MVISLSLEPSGLNPQSPVGPLFPLFHCSTLLVCPRLLTPPLSFTLNPIPVTINTLFPLSSLYFSSLVFHPSSVSHSNQFLIELRTSPLRGHGLVNMATTSRDKIYTIQSFPKGRRGVNARVVSTARGPREKKQSAPKQRNPLNGPQNSDISHERVPRMRQINETGPILLVNAPK